MDFDAFGVADHAPLFLPRRHVVDKKDCPVCDKTKSVSEFHKNRTTADGYNGECKECKKARDTEYRSRPEVRARRNKQSRVYSRLFGYLYRGKYDVDWSKYRETQKAWLARNPDADRAFGKLHRAIKAKAIPKATDCACVNCGRAAEIYRWPNGYSEELNVVAMCHECYGEHLISTHIEQSFYQRREAVYSERL